MTISWADNRHQGYLVSPEPAKINVVVTPTAAIMISACFLLMGMAVLAAAYAITFLPRGDDIHPLVVFVTGTPETVATLTPTITPSPTPTFTATIAPTETPWQTITPTRLPSSYDTPTLNPIFQTATAYKRTTPTPEQNVERLCLVFSSHNVRAGPSIDARIIAVRYPPDPVELYLGVTATADGWLWQQIVAPESPDGMGWVADHTLHTHIKYLKPCD